MTVIRKSFRFAALAITAVVVLSGCSTSDDAATTPANTPAAVAPTAPAPATAPSDEDVALINAITVSGALGTEPEVHIDVPLELSFPTTRLLSDGTGPALTDGQMVTLKVAAWRGDNGEQLFSTWEDSSTESFIMGGQDLAVFSALLEGTHVGARGIVANPINFQGEFFTVVNVFEVVDALTIPNRATGAAVTVAPDSHLPIVTLDADGAPSITFPDGFEASDELVVQPLIEGTGPVVRPESNLMVHYTGWLLDGTEFDSSWARSTPASFPLPNVVAGWRQGLAGQHVGSQILLVIPPELAYEDRQAGIIPPNSTLVFVVDILWAD